MAYTSNFDSTDFLNQIKSLKGSDYQELIFENLYDKSKLTDFVPLLTGQRHGDVLPRINAGNNYNSFPFLTDGSCDIPLCDLSDEYSSEKVELATIGCKIEYCFNKDTTDFKNFWRVKHKGATLSDAFAAYMAGKLKAGHEGALWRIWAYGDKSSASNHLNQINGVFTQAFAAAGDDIIPLASNAKATRAEQRQLGETEAREAFDELVLKYQESDWSQKPAAILCTLELYNNYKRDLRANTTTCCARYDEVSRGGFTAPLDYDGVSIIAPKELRSANDSYQTENLLTGALPAYKPNHAIITPLTNIPLLTEGEYSFRDFNPYHSLNGKTLYIEMSSKIGVGFNEDEFFVAG